MISSRLAAALMWIVGVLAAIFLGVAVSTLDAAFLVAGLLATLVWILAKWPFEQPLVWPAFRVAHSQAVHPTKKGELYGRSISVVPIRDTPCILVVADGHLDDATGNLRPLSLQPWQMLPRLQGYRLGGNRFAFRHPEQPNIAAGTTVLVSIYTADTDTSMICLQPVSWWRWFRLRADPPNSIPPPSTNVPEDPLRISTASLPASDKTFVAREKELATLDTAWQGGTNVVSFAAIGGAGKSALLNEWLRRMQKDRWRGAELVLGWSFHSQGTESSPDSSDKFTAFALEWFRYEGDPINDRWKKGLELAHLVREHRTLLLLDGLEPLQHPPGAQTGHIKDRAVQALVRDLAADNPGLCVLTSRLPVADLAGREGTVTVDLEPLSPEAGAELLERLKVKGSKKELRAAAKESGGHALAIILLGTYLRDLHQGNVGLRSEVRVLDNAVEIEGSRHARRMLASYEALFGDGPELPALHLLGLFDRPAEAAALAALRVEPEIPGLTAGIGKKEEAAWKQAVVRLRRARLVAEAEGDEGGLDAHPLVREYFGARLAHQEPQAWKEGNLRLYNYYQQVPATDLPETLDELLALYTAIVHGCRAGLVQEAFDQVFRRRIHRGSESYSAEKLEAFGAERTALGVCAAETVYVG